jgi:adenylate cyclase
LYPNCDKLDAVRLCHLQSFYSLSNAMDFPFRSCWSPKQGGLTLERRLAAILAADVVGYTRLMGLDEAGTLRRLNDLREKVLAPLITKHHGRIVKLMGDGLLVEFASVVNAVTCAVAWQEDVTGHESDFDTDTRLLFRLGINLGDVIVDGGDIHGDGVNVAARLEALAEPGGICISGDVYRQAKGKIEVRFEDMGAQNLKNVAEPFRVYRIAGDGSAMAAPSATTDAPSLIDKPSIAVHPFTNMSSDPEQNYFADGITEDIITDLSKISSLFVIARNSSFVYKGGPVNIPTIAKELGVRFVLEGSVRRGGNRVRINAQLIDAETGGHLWADRYDRDLTDIFAVQDEVTANIVQALAITLGGDERRRIGKKGTENFAAYECVLRGREIFLNLQNSDPELGKIEFNQAIELDPNFGLPHAYLAQMHIVDIVNSWGDDPQKSLMMADKFAKRGAELAPDDAHAHIALGSVKLFYRLHEEAIAEAERAVQLNPNYAHGLFELGWYLQYAGRAAESLDYFDRAVQLDPHHSDQFLHFIAQAYFQLGRYDEAAELLRQRITRSPHSDSSRMMMAACYGHLGQFDDAHTIWSELIDINPDFSLDQRRVYQPYKNPEDFEKIAAGLNKASLLE